MRTHLTYLKRGGQVLAGILNDFEPVEDALKTMENAAGSADREMGIIQDSIDYKLNALKETWVGTMQNLVSRESIGGVLDFLTTLSEGIGGVIDQLGVLGTAFVGAGTIFGGKSGLLFRTNDEGNLTFGLGEKIASAISNKKDIASLTKLRDYISSNGIQDGMFDKLYGGFDKLNGKTKEVVDSLTDVKITADDAIKSIDYEINGLTKSASRLGNVFKNIGAGLLNMAISIGITYAAKGLSNLIDKAIQTKEEIHEVAQTFEEEFDSMQSSQKEFSKNLAQYDEEFKKLSKGVNSLGENVSLTAEEFDRYREISDAVATQMPELIIGWDNQNQAIVNLRDNVDSLTEAYKRNQQEQARTLYNSKTDDDIEYAEAISKDFRDSTADKVYKNVVHGGGGFIAPGNTFGSFVSPTTVTKETYTITDQQQILTDLLDADYKTIKEIYETGNEYQKEVLETAGFTAETLDDNIEAVHMRLQKELDDIESDIAHGERIISKAATTYAQTLPTYWNGLKDESRKYVDLVLNNLSFDFIKDNGLDDLEKRETFVSDLIQKFNDFDENDIAQIELRFNLETMFNNGEITSVGEYISKVEELEDWINTLPEETQKYIRLLFDIDSDDISNRVSKVLRKMENNGILTVNAMKFVDKLTPEQFGLWEKALNDGTIPPDLLAKSEASWMNFIDSLQEVADKNKLEIKASDAVDSMADAKTALNSLEALYDQVVNKTEKEGQATGFADPALINSVESAFSKFVTDDEAGQKLNAALENFEKTLVEFPDDADEAQDAMDELITAYIDQTDIIKNLTEENAEWSKAQLTAMGITNAEEVVMTRLNKTSKKLSEGLSKVTETLKANADALQESKQGTTEYEEAIKQLANDVAEMLSFQSEDGTISFDASTVVDSSFIEAHRADIDAMVEGDIDALNRVRAAAAKAAVMTVMVDMPTEAAEQQVNHIMDMVAQADAMNIDVGASIDDSAFLQALSNMVGQSQTMANAVSKAFETMGYNVKFIPNKYKMRVPSGGNVTTVYGGPDAGQAIHWTEAELDIPSVQITRAGTAGAKATYTPPANTPSGGGGGGGGGGGNGSDPTQPKAETEETFDWIAVAIQRLEEEETRLGKIVDNVYDHWEDRNEALGKQIDTLRKDVQAEYLAYLEYARNAEELQVKPLNDADYGENDQLVKAEDQRLYEEAVAKVATGEYQRKIREGQLTGDDIESISNHFLTDWIKEYQTRLNNAIQSADKVKDKEIELGDAAKKRFDLVKSEFDGLIGIIDAKADIIEKRIDKAQARGFFTDEKYYKQLIAYNDQEYAKVLAEYKGLVAARDKALAEGSIAKNSEEWVAMSTDILNAKGRLDELTTSTINYRKELNQIKWDKFEFLNENLQRVNTEMADLIELMGNHELVDEKGIFNEYGQATLAMYLGQYNALANEQKVLQEQYKEAQKDLKDDPLNKEKIENLQRLEDALRENAKERINIEKSVTDEFKNAIDTRLNYLNELIDKYNEALDSEKDLYSYQKNIQKQVENISHLERMLNAYEGDDSEEARKIRQVTGAQLEEARQQLEETEWDRMISETKKSLSDLSEDYNEYLNEAIKKWENVFKAGMQVVNSNMESIRTTIENTAKDNFFSLSDELQYALDTSTSRTDEDYYGVAMDIIKNGNNSSWGNSSANQNKHLEDRGFDSARIREIIAELQSGHKYAGGSIDSNEMQSVFAGIAYEILKTGKDSAWGSSRKEQVANWTKLWGSDIANNISAMADSMNAAHKNGVSWATLAEANGFDTDYTKYQKKLYGEAWDNLLGAYGISANDLSKYQKTQYSTGYASPASGYSQAFITTQTKAYNNVGTIASTLDIIKQYVSDLSDNQKAEQQKDDEETDNKTDGKHYAKGTHHVTRDEIAITQENGTEIMFRASDGSMLTPLGAGDMVFTNEMSQRLWDIAKNGLPTGINATVPQVASNVGNTINQDNAISITLPNVTNYDEFKAALKKDTQFTNFVQEITVGQLAGNNTLKKNRY